MINLDMCHIFIGLKSKQVQLDYNKRIGVFFDRCENDM